jgi:hypothetical protein
MNSMNNIKIVIQFLSICMDPNTFNFPIARENPLELQVTTSLHQSCLMIAPSFCPIN